MNIRTLIAAVLWVCALSACTPGMDAMVQTVQSAIQRDTGAATARLDPNYSYLRVTIGGRLAFLARGYVDGHPHGPIEVYYSAQREVVRIQNGRVVGVVGFATEWRNVSIAEAPAWSAVAGAQQPVAAGGQQSAAVGGGQRSAVADRQQGVQWVRMRDVMPGYRFGVRDELELRVIASPARSELHAVDPRRLTWFEERMQADARGGYLAGLLPGTVGERPLPPARYAVDLSGGKESVVYGEQCIAPDTCFTWQRWSADQQSKAVKSER